ncbi:hypothetical protein Goe19_01920 [Bacillus phage vB_BsuM-Goe19]|nr:hypothetical protein Goe19_01920 [Bacillus phage vB_BsuM-Goe19]
MSKFIEVTLDSDTMFKGLKAVRSSIKKDAIMEVSEVESIRGEQKGEKRCKIRMADTLGTKTYYLLDSYDEIMEKLTHE